MNTETKTIEVTVYKVEAVLHNITSMDAIPRHTLGRVTVTAIADGVEHGWIEQDARRWYPGDKLDITVPVNWPKQ